MRRSLVLLLVLGAGTAACGNGVPNTRSGGPSEAVQVACAPFQHIELLQPSTGSGEIAGSIGPLPTEWVNQLLKSGDDPLVDYAKTFANGQASSRVIGDIQSECRKLGA